MNKQDHSSSVAEKFATNMAEQLRMAGLVQRDFLPKSLPNSEKMHWTATFLPAEWVSGDIYDVVRLDENHIGFYVADVVGHGVPAALLTIFVKQALVMRETKEKSYHIFEPEDVMRNLNNRMTEQKLSGCQFVTCCYCLLNTDTMELTYARAGHPYPILIKKDSACIQLESKGALLGIFEDGQFSQSSVKLEQGDKLLLYSDGVEPYIGKYEDDNEFSYSPEFCDIKNLPGEEFCAEFNDLIQRLKYKEPINDDITVVTLDIL